SVNLPVECRRRRFWLDSELALQSIGADPVLIERRRRAPGLKIEAHQRAVDRLLQRIHCEESQAGLEGGVDRTPADRMSGEPLQHIDGAAPKPFPLALKPRLETGLFQVKAAEEITAVQCEGLHECGRLRAGGESLEPRHVDLDDCGHGDIIALRYEERHPAPRE